LHCLRHSVKAVLRQELDSFVRVVRLILVGHGCVSFRRCSDLEKKPVLARSFKRPSASAAVFVTLASSRNENRSTGDCSNYRNNVTPPRSLKT
jgi:hypothetical protein